MLTERKLKQLATKTLFDEKRFLKWGRCIINEKGYAFGQSRNGKFVWAILKNRDYEKNLDLEFPNKYYISILCVPKYNIYGCGNNYGKKMSWALPRISKLEEEFLFIPKNPPHIKRNCYIWELDEGHKIKQGSPIYADLLSEKGLEIISSLQK